MRMVLGVWIGVGLLFGVLPAGVVFAQAAVVDGATVPASLDQVVQASEDNDELKVSDILISVALLVLVFLFGLMIFSG